MYNIHYQGQNGHLLRGYNRGIIHGGTRVVAQESHQETNGFCLVFLNEWLQNNTSGTVMKISFDLRGNNYRSMVPARDFDGDGIAIHYCERVIDRVNELRG